MECTEEDVTEELASFVMKYKTEEAPPPSIKFSITDSDDFDDDFDSDENNDDQYETIQPTQNAISKFQSAVENKVDIASIKGKIFSFLPSKNKKESKIDIKRSESSASSKSSQITVNEDKIVNNELYVSAVEGITEGITYDFQNPEIEEPDEEEVMSVGSYKGAGTMMRVIFSYEAKVTYNYKLIQTFICNEIIIIF